MYRRFDVPFVAVRKKVVIPVYTVDCQDELEDGTGLDVFVPLKAFLDAVVDPEVYEVTQSGVPAGISVGKMMQDWSEHCRGKGKCITWRDLSTIGWGIKRKDGKPDQLSIRVLFFAQCVMRGFLHRLVQVEGNIRGQLEAGETVFWKPYVDIMRREVESYKHVDQTDSGLPDFVKDEVTAMWRRVKQLVSGNNKENLKNALANRNAKVLVLHE